MAKRGKRDKTFPWTLCWCSWGFCRWSSFLCCYSDYDHPADAVYCSPWCCYYIVIMIYSSTAFDILTLKKITLDTNQEQESVLNIWCRWNSPVNRDGKQYIQWYQTEHMLSMFWLLRWWWIDRGHHNIVCWTRQIQKRGTLTPPLWEGNQ